MSRAARPIVRTQVSTNRGQVRLKRLLLSRLRAVRGRLAIAAACLVLAVATELAAPWPLKLIFDQILLGQSLPAGLQWASPLFAWGNGPALAMLAASIFCLVLVGGAAAYVQIYITARLGHELAYALRGALFTRLQGAPLSFHVRLRSGEQLTRFATDTNALRDLAADSLLTLAGHVVLLVGMLAVMFWVNWPLAVVVTATLPVLAGVLAFLNRRIRQSLTAQRRQEGQMASRMNEVLSSIAVVQAFGREGHENTRFDVASARNLEDGVRTARATAAVARSIALVAAAATAVTVLVGAHQVMDGRMTPGDLLVFMAYLRTLYKPLRNLGKLSVKLTRAKVSAERIAEVLAIEPEITDRKGAIRPDTLAGDIEFRDVSFGYDAGRPVLSSVSLAIRAGERVAVVGASGSGKSTLINLILRLYEPQSGSVSVDGIDVRDYARTALRREIGIVLQDTVLFGVTVSENIAYGKPDATPAEIEAAARAAHAHDFIMGLPDGYDTVLGERGGSLSGGQRQRICLARAIVKRPSILVLDEPTAAIDPMSTALIDEAVRRLQAGRTTIVVSHQYHGMRDFDRIFVMRDGRIVEHGAHDELLRRSPHYNELLQGRAA